MSILLAAMRHPKSCAPGHCAAAAQASFLQPRRCGGPSIAAGRRAREPHRRMPRFLSRKMFWIAIAATVALTIVGVLVAVNLSSGEKRIQQVVKGGYGVEDPRFLHVVGVLLGPPVVGGNRYRVLRNGDEIFPAMLDAIAGAKRSISFETYIYWSGEIGRRFADALAE